MIAIDKLAANLGFEEEEVAMLLEMFLESASESMRLLQNAIDQRDFAQIKQHAHAIKGSAANLMLEDIYAIAKEIEEAGANQREINYAQIYILLENKLNRLKVEAHT